MDQQQIDAVLNDATTRELLARSPLMRVAYTGRDGAPRVVPVAYVVRDGRFVFATAESAAKVAALRADPRVAVTIDTPHPELCCLLLRGTVSVDIVEGVPDEYLEASLRTVPAEQHAMFEQQVRGLYDRMARFVVAPTFARLNDFVRTAPRAVERIIAAKS
ncbi:pyridoxamine 5'-phosphate oxidase family protein [Jatrophihabitans fulvus]